MAPVTHAEQRRTLSATVAQASRSNDRWLGAGAGEKDPRFRLLSIRDDAFPERLRGLEETPTHLYVSGLMPAMQAPVAIVGNREASPAGLEAAFDLASALAERGHPIVSGLAAGIDAAAHRGALAVDGPTIAVVGTGPDCVFPPENSQLQDEILERGIIVSQFPFGQGPSKTTFPARNAIIAGLSAASLLVEMNERSGTRIQANLTLEQGKPVLLWEPILGREAWAHEFATHPLVTFVSSVDEIVGILDRQDRD